MADALWRDLRYAARTLLRSPGFTVAAVLTLTLGIGANTAIFSLLDAVVFKPLPVRQAGELVALYEQAPGASPDATGGTGQFLVFSHPRFVRLESAVGADGILAAMTRSHQIAVRDGARTVLASAQLVSGRYFDAFGVRTTRGRVLTSADVRVDRPAAVAVVSAAFAQRSLGGPDAAVGRRLRVNDVSFEVVGVAEPGFVGGWTDTVADVWLPLTLQHAIGYQANVSSYARADRSQPWGDQDGIAWLTLVARVPAPVRAGVGARLAAANRLGVADLAATFNEEPPRREILAHQLVVEPFARGFSGLRDRFGTALLALTALVAVMLLATCANIASLLLARGTARAREIGVRTALGASKAAILTQSLAESVLLAAAGGGGGLVLGLWASRFMAAMALPPSPAGGDLPPAFLLDGRVLAFTALLTTGAALAFGLLPAWRVSRAPALAYLGGGKRDGRSALSFKSMRPLMIAQLALSFVLVLAAGLFDRTLTGLTRIDAGFSTDGVVNLVIDPATSGYDRAQAAALDARILAAVRRVPGVQAASLSVCTLGANCTSRYLNPRQGSAESRGVSLQNGWIAGDYFATLRIPVLAGRTFDDRDTLSNRRVAIVSASAARAIFGDESPLGHSLRNGTTDMEIVGLVADVRGLNVRDAPVPAVYLPVTQPSERSPLATSVEVRVSGDAGRAVLPVLNAIRQEEPRLIVPIARTMEQRVARVLMRERLVAYLSSGFGALALLLVCVGLYGVLSYSVTGRRVEIGVRAALGARPAALASMVLRDTSTVVVPGLGLGIGLAVISGRLAEGLLYGITAFDVPTYAAAVAALAGVSLVAAYLPARRAAMADPVRSLRSE